MALLQKIVPNLWFQGNAEEAVDFYTSAFEDGSIISRAYYPTENLIDFQKDFAGEVLTINFTLAGQEFTAINAGPEFTFSEAISFVVQCKDQDEIDYFWDKLSAVPESEQCGWCKDKFGLSWQIVPEHIDELMAGPNGSSNSKAFKALLEMKKIDIAALEQASLKNEPKRAM